MFAHRSAWCGAVLLGVLVMCTGRAEPPSPGAGPSPAGKESPEIQALIKEQREAVEKIWEGVKALREIGQDVPQNFRVNINYDALLELDLSAAATLEERVKARQRYLDQMRRFEQYWEEQLKRQKDAGQRGEPSNEDGVLDIYLDAKVVRLNTEIELLRVKTPAGEKEPSQIETRLKELRVVQEQVLKQTRKQFEEAQAAAKAGKARGGSPRELASLGANLLRAELIVASRPEERVKAYEKYVPLAKAVEQTVKERYDLGRDGMDAVLRAKDALEFPTKSGH